MHQFLHGLAYLVGKLNLASVITTCLYLLFYTIDYFFPFPEEALLHDFLSYHAICSGIIALAVMDASLMAFFFTKLAEKFYIPIHHCELAPPDTKKINRWIVGTSLLMLAIVAACSPAIVQKQAWAQITSAYCLFFAILGLITYLTLKTCNQWLRTKPLTVIGFHVASFFIQVAINLVLLNVLLISLTQAFSKDI
ncbi:MAG: hypothetical protein R3Y56_07900 [Akkermansia sp.]